MSFLSMILLTSDPAAIIAVQNTFLPADPLSAFVVGVLVFILVVFFLLILALIQFKRILYPSEKPALKGLMQQLTDIVPVENEAAILTDHVYDGIRELDNNLPPWWKYLFYATIVYSFGYMYYYHFTDTDRLQIGEYQQELRVAEADMVEYRKHAANSIDESNVKMPDAAGIKEGDVLFQENCIACHGKTGEGGVGPNLVDEYWLHGGSLTDVFKTIKYGVPQKGMISWKSQLSPLNLQQLTGYIMNLKGTNPGNAKAPQGDKYEAK